MVNDAQGLAYFCRNRSNCCKRNIMTPPTLLKKITKIRKLDRNTNSNKLVEPFLNLEKIDYRINHSFNGKNK